MNRRDHIAALLAMAAAVLPGNLISEDSANPDAIWIVELWDSKAAHAAPVVQGAIKKGRPLIAGFGMQAEFKPVSV